MNDVYRSAVSAGLIIPPGVCGDRPLLGAQQGVRFLFHAANHTIRRSGYREGTSPWNVLLHSPSHTHEGSRTIPPAVGM